MAWATGGGAVGEERAVAPPSSSMAARVSSPLTARFGFFRIEIQCQFENIRGHWP